MKEELNSLTGHSVMGFSHSFSCCHYWKSCDYGKNGCMYEETDPLATSGCRCYQRNFKKTSKEDSISILKLVEEPKVIEERTKILNSEQMSLF